MTGGKKGGRSKGGTACTGGYKGVRPESVAGGGWFEVLWNLECLVGLSQREICVNFNEGNIGTIWTVRRKIKNCGAT